MKFNQLKKLFSRAENVRLDEQAREKIRQNVFAFVKEHPLSQKKPKNNWLGLQMAGLTKLNLKTPSMVLASIMILFLTSTVTVAKANTALPGEFLYPIKINLNEKIKETLAFSQQAKLNLHISLAELRLKEITQIIARGKNDNYSEKQATDNFNKHAMEAMKKLGQLSKENNTPYYKESATSFEASLKANSMVINGLQKKYSLDLNDSLTNNIDKTLLKISDIINNQTKSKNSSQSTEPKDQPKVNNEIKILIESDLSVLEDSLSTAKELIDDKKISLGERAVIESRGNLELARQKIDEGKKAFLENNYESSHSALRQASVIIQQSKYLINAKTRLNVDIPIGIQSLEVNKKEENGIEKKLEIQNQEASDSNNTNTKTNQEAKNETNQEISPSADVNAETDPDNNNQY